MAQITVSSQEIEEHLDGNGVSVYSFTWNQHSKEPEIEFTVNRDLVFENDDLIDASEYDEVVVERDRLREDVIELSVELEDKNLKYKTLSAEYDELNRLYNNLKAEKSLWNKLHFWK